MLRLLLLLAFCSLLVSSASAQPQRKPEGEPLLNWSLWQQYRTTIKHPAAAIKPDDLRRARANIEQYAWAKGYRDGVENGAKSWPGKLTPRFDQASMDLSISCQAYSRSTGSNSHQSQRV